MHTHTYPYTYVDVRIRGAYVVVLEKMSYSVVKLGGGSHGVCADFRGDVGAI
jgi:hypothetical protein